MNSNDYYNSERKKRSEEFSSKVIGGCIAGMALCILIALITG